MYDDADVDVVEELDRFGEDAGDEAGRRSVALAEPGRHAFASVDLPNNRDLASGLGTDERAFVAGVEVTVAPSVRVQGEVGEVLVEDVHGGRDANLITAVLELELLDLVDGLSNKLEGVVLLDQAELKHGCTRQCSASWQVGEEENGQFTSLLAVRGTSDDGSALQGRVFLLRDCRKRNVDPR